METSILVYNYNPSAYWIRFNILSFKDVCAAV